MSGVGVGLKWPGTAMVYGEPPSADAAAIKAVIDEFGDQVRDYLAGFGAPATASPYFRPWGIVIGVTPGALVIGLLPASGMAEVQWVTASSSTVVTPESLASSYEEQMGVRPTHGVVLPLPDAEDRESAVGKAVQAHIKELNAEQRFKKLNVPEGVMNDETNLARFLNDHPDPDRNVFVMMRFIESPQLEEAYETVKATLASRGYDVVRADDKDYTGSLWSNVELYLSCCNLGVAIFEDIEKRDFNPNVSLELGYMIGRGKRTLILKERHMPDLHADLMHRLYKPWDQFEVSGTVEKVVSRWADVDLK